MSRLQMKILDKLIQKAIRPFKTMSSIYNGYYAQYRNNNPSTNKRTYQNSYTSSSKPISNSIRKDPKYPESLLQKNIYNSPLQYYPSQSNSKVMINSLKEPKVVQINDRNQKIQTSQFRINDPKKSETFLRGALRQQDQRKPTDSYKDYRQDYRMRQDKYTIEEKPIGLVGLNNIGNTCFMNSTLQCILNLPSINNYFLEDRHLKQMQSTGRVTSSYAKLLKAVRSGQYRAETPSELKMAVAAKKPRFQGYAQQDAQQFLTGILQLMSQQLNRSSKPTYKQLTADTSRHTLQQISEEWWKYNKQRQDSIITDFFTGQLLSRVVCSKCRNQSIAFDNTWDFALNFNKYDDGEILTMVENFLKEQTISSDYYCSKCKSFRQCTRKLDFWRLPKIIVFELKRFSYGKYRKLKLNNRVKIRQTLDLSSLTKLSKHSSVKNPIYDLVGIVNHSGDIDYGHYTAECRNLGNKKWYTFNDSSVYESNNKQNYESANPYLLFYVKKQIQ